MKDTILLFRLRAKVNIFLLNCGLRAKQQELTLTYSQTQAV